MEEYKVEIFGEFDDEFWIFMDENIFGIFETVIEDDQVTIFCDDEIDQNHVWELLLEYKFSSGDNFHIQ